MRLGILQIAARRWICIRAAADADQCDRPGIIAFNRFLRETAPIAVNLVPLATECRAMARVVYQNAAQFAVGAVHEHCRQCVVHRRRVILAELRAPLANHPAVLREFHRSFAPRQLRWRAIAQRRQRNAFEVVHQLARVAVNRRLLFRNNV